MNAFRIHQLASLIVLARHGKAIATDGKPDAERELNELGVRQAGHLRFAIQEFGITTVLSSPLRRVIDTVRIATSDLDEVVIRLVHELTCSDDPKDPLMVMWTALGNVPISRYFAHELGEHLKTWGRIALASILRELNNGEKAQENVLIGGHALLLNALLWAIAESIEDVSGADNLKRLADITLGEGEAFVVRFELKLDWSVMVKCDHLGPMAS